MPEMGEIAAAFCSEEENARINAAPPEKKLEVFFSLWTRKEAFLKATGEGIAGNLAQLDCSEAAAGLVLPSALARARLLPAPWPAPPPPPGRSAGSGSKSRIFAT